MKEGLFKMENKEVDIKKFLDEEGKIMREPVKQFIRDYYQVSTWHE